MARVFAISDLHVDYKENLEWVKNWPAGPFKKDALILAGDVTDNLQTLENCLRSLKNKFAEVAFVPGNHELWIRPKEGIRDSVAKFRRILSLCERMGVHTKPFKFQVSCSEAVWVVPLHSWYSTPEEDFMDTLYMTHPALKEDLRKCQAMWMDNHMCKWPTLNGLTKSRYFAAMNDTRVNRTYDAPVITFSHMVPRRDLIKGDPEDMAHVNCVRQRNGLGAAPRFSGMQPGFNFTRYAGASIIDAQARKIGARIHVYGHQHRNRDRTVDGVQYVSHCLGNVKEQKEGYTWGITDWNGPKQIYPPLAQGS